MNSVVTLAQGIALAYAAGINLYAAVAVTGIVVRLGYAPGAPSGIATLGSSWVIVVAATLAIVELVATSIPGVAAAWETVHSLVRPPAAAVLAAAVSWQADPLIVLIAALLGGATAIATHTAKLGLRYALDASRRRSPGAVASVAEFLLVAVLAAELWTHPFLTAPLAAVVFAVVLIAMRTIWHALRQVFSGHWMPSRGLMQAPRASQPIDMSPETNSPV